MKVRFKAIGIWPLNPKAMENKTQPSNICTTTNVNTKEGPRE
jgi:hypothetical protein